MSDENYKINLRMFEGPLDLLLYLIKKSDLEITDIPIAKVLEQYLEYLDVMKELDVDIAGEFIFMASELTHIKSKMLLNEKEEFEEEGQDPRSDLVRRLLEYQKFKTAALWLGKQPMLFREVFKRPKMQKPDEIELEEQPLDVDPFTLVSVFNEILKRVPASEIQSHHVQMERVSVTEKIYSIVERLKLEEVIDFIALFEGQDTRSELVVTFLAILEMARLKMVRIFQSDSFGTIRLQRRAELDDTKIKEEITNELGDDYHG